MGHASLASALLASDATGAALSLDQILAASRSAAELTRQMLAYSGRGKFVVEEIDLSILIRETSDFARTLISKKAEVAVNLAPDLPHIDADRGQIRQVLVNLLTNASESLENAAGHITITTGLVWVDRAEISTYGSGAKLPEGEYVFVEVKDTGCGMDHETIQRIFDPFFTTKFTGRGLGLAAVIGIVRGHKGHLTVESAVGRGSTFRLLFPSSPHSSPATATKEVAIGADSDWKGSGVALVADDEKGIRDMAAAVLSRAGFTVITAHDGLDAVRKFRQHQASISIVLLDLTMPGMDGIEVLQHIRRLSTEVKVVLSSGYNLQEIDERLTPGLVDGFLCKPYQPSDLVAIVRAAIARPERD
jgi:CheY-like chemotaxis protein